MAESQGLDDDESLPRSWSSCMREESVKPKCSYLIPKAMPSGKPMISRSGRSGWPAAEAAAAMASRASPADTPNRDRRSGRDRKTGLGGCIGLPLAGEPADRPDADRGSLAEPTLGQP